MSTASENDSGSLGPLARWCTAIVTGIALALPIMGGSAEANNFGSTDPGGDPSNSVSLANNGHHHVDFMNVDSQQYNMTVWVHG